MDNNQAERALRGPVVGRKNYYGSGATWSGELSATLFSLFHTLERWRINPRTWLTEYLRACADAGGRVPADFERFLPWNRRDGQAPIATPALPAPPQAGPTAVPPEAGALLRTHCSASRRLEPDPQPSSPRTPTAIGSRSRRLVCERLHWRRANGQLKDMSCRVAMLRMHRDGLIQLPGPRQHACYNGTPAPPPYPAGRTGVADHRPRRCAVRRCSYDRSPIRRGSGNCGASTWTATTTSAIRRCREHRCATWCTSQRPQVLAVRRLWRQRLEGGSPRPASSAGALPNAKRGLQLVVNNARFLILPWVQVRNPRFHGAGSQQPPAARRLAQLATATDRSCWRPSCSPTASPVPATAPPTGPTSDRPKVAANSTSITNIRAAQEGHLALPAQARLPPPTLRATESSSPPVDRMFTPHNRTTRSLLVSCSRLGTPDQPGIRSSLTPPPTALWSPKSPPGRDRCE